MFSLSLKNLNLMTNLEKSDYFDNNHNKETNPATIKKLGSQSIQIALSCGCIQTQNLLCGKPRSKETHPSHAEHESLRFQYFEFCNNHKKS